MKIIKKEKLNEIMYTTRTKDVSFRTKDSHGNDCPAMVRDQLKILIDTPKKSFTRADSKSVDNIYIGLDDLTDLILDDKDYEYLKKTFDSMEIGHKQIFDALANAIDSAEDYKP